MTVLPSCIKLSNPSALRLGISSPGRTAVSLLPDLILMYLVPRMFAELMEETESTGMFFKVLSGTSIAIRTRRFGILGTGERDAFHLADLNTVQVHRSGVGQRGGVAHVGEDRSPWIRRS